MCARPARQSSSGPALPGRHLFLSGRLRRRLGNRVRRLGVERRGGGRGSIFGYQGRDEACHVGRIHPENPQRLRQRPCGRLRGGGGPSGWRPHVCGRAEWRGLRGDLRRAQRRLWSLWRPLEAASAPSRNSTTWYLAGGGGNPSRWSATLDECNGGEVAAAQGIDGGGVLLLSAALITTASRGARDSGAHES